MCTNASLAPHPPAPPPPHIFSTRIPQTPQTSTEGMPVGLVTLSCWKSVWTGMLSWACSVPSRASPRMLSSVACMAKPSRAESWKQSAAVPESLSSPYLWAGVAGAPGEPALPPPRAVMQAGAGQRAKAKGQAGDPVNASLLLIRRICSRVPNCSAVKTASGQLSGRPAPSAAGQGRGPAHGEGRALPHPRRVASLGREVRLH